jgi:Kef-type K+ transport system membrane component KefB
MTAPRRLASVLLLPVIVLATMSALPASAADSAPAGGAGHTDPVTAVLLYLAIILIVAKLGGDLAARLGQPAVLGELVLGVLIGNLSLVGITWLAPLAADQYIDLLARLGVVVLLFEVGLESTVPQMMKVGAPALVVATLGVVAPMMLGYLVGRVMLPAESVYLHVFLGATLSATSVGITARVFQDLGRSQTDEARLILGAAVIDDVLGLVILAVVVGIIQGADSGGLSGLEVALIVVKAAGFLGGALILGRVLSPRMFALASRLRAQGMLLAVALAFCFALSWLAGLIGLAPIVGAFAAGLVLEQVHYQDLVDREKHTLEHLVHPIGAFLVPVFFVVMGVRTDLASFAQPGVLGLAAALTAAAILGKQVCALGVFGGPIDRLVVGVGMIPRGEVGLIFASIGAGLSVGGKPLVGPEVFSAVVVMVIVTTLVTPPALKVVIARADRRVRVAGP